MINRTVSFLTNFFAICIFAVCLVTISGCSLHDAVKQKAEYNSTMGLQDVEIAVLQSEIERFKQAEELSCSDIPELYDTSHLKSGSMVKIKTLDREISDDFFYFTLTVNNIQNTGKENLYVIDSDFATIKMSRNSISRPVCKDTLADIKTELHTQKAEQLVKEKIKELKSSGFNIGPAVAGGILYGPVGAAVGSVVSVIDYSERKGRAEKTESTFSQIREAMTANTKTETKLVNFKLISHEDILIKDKSVSCNVYQVDRISMTTLSPVKVNNMTIQGSTTVQNWSQKLWISDEVPFGAVKIEQKTSFVSQAGSNAGVKSIHEKITTSEVEEFNY